MEHALVCSSRRDSVVNLWGRCRSASQPDLSPFRFTPANMTLEITVFVIDDDPVERKFDHISCRVDAAPRRGFCIV